MQWLVVSLALSVVLTVVVNVALRAIPESGRRAARWLAEHTPPGPSDTMAGQPRARLFVPWKAMIVASIILTVLLNLLRWVR